MDYTALRTAPTELDAYLNELAAVKPDEFAAWNRENRLALLLNLYNARTLRLIIDHYPLKSIRDIGALPGAAWRQLIVRFGGQIMTLEHLENKIIRAGYGEPRIHFALVCAAKGCPPLRSEPYEGQRLDSQLDEQAQQFLATAEKNRFDAAKDTLWLSPIFKWYGEDFEKKSGGVLRFLKPYWPEKERAMLDGETEGFVRAFSTSDPQKLWLVTAQGKREIVIPRNVTNWVDVKGCVSPDGGFVALHVWQTHPNNKRSRSIHLGNLR